MPNPFAGLARDAVGKVVADSWTAAMLALWQAGLWLLQVVLRWIDALTTPDLSEHGPGGELYRTTFWLAGVLMLAMLMVQLGLAAIRRSGQSLATAALGAAKFLVVWGGWLGYGVAVVAACGGISRGLLESLLQVESWRAWQPWQKISTSDITEAAVATVLGLMGLLVWLAAIGHLLVMITRAGALIVLAAMTPVAAAGLLAEPGQAWFWKSFRWFHAAAFTPPLMVAMLGVGVQLTRGVATGFTGSTQQAIGTALPGVILILISAAAPLALFKLLAFVDPTTNSGAAFRSGLASVGGLGGLIGGRTAGGGSDPVEAADPGSGDGDRTAGEDAADDQTATRFTAQLASVAGGPAGGLFGGLVDGAQTFADTAAAVGSDLTNQMGVGHTSWYPDHSGGARSDPETDGEWADADGADHGGGPSGVGDGWGPAGGQQPDEVTDPAYADDPSRPGGGPGYGDTAPRTPTPAPASGPTPSPSGGGAAGGGAEAGVAAEAAAVPVVPV